MIVIMEEFADVKCVINAGGVAVDYASGEMDICIFYFLDTAAFGTFWFFINKPILLLSRNRSDI